VSLVHVQLQGRLATVTLNDPERRNALSADMFRALEAAFAALQHHDASMVLHLRSNGPVFCAGFDLAACVSNRGLLASFIHRLSHLNRTIRRLRQVVVVEVQGAALAGGCALLSACDFVCVAADATLGYPVHRIGVSPAVSLPTLLSATGGAARPLTLSAELIDGSAALRIGLATHCAANATDTAALAASLCDELRHKGPIALAATKAWLNELDGSDRDDAFDRTAENTASLCDGDECVQMLGAFWASRRKPA